MVGRRRAVLPARPCHDRPHDFNPWVVGSNPTRLATGTQQPARSDRVEGVFFPGPILLIAIVLVVIALALMARR